MGCGDKDDDNGSAEELANVAVEALNDLGAASLIRSHQLAQILGVELFGPRREADEVDEKNAHDLPLDRRHGVEFDGIPGRIPGDRLFSPLCGLRVSHYRRGDAVTSTPEGQELHLHGD